jgi:hypothetical protein
MNNHLAMVKTLLILGTYFLSVFCSFAQPAANKHFFELTGNYVEVTQNENSKQKSLDMSMSYGYAVSPSFIAGAALKYNHEKYTSVFTLFYPGTTQRPTYMAKTETETVDKVFEPSLFLRYYHPIAKGLYFSSRLDLFTGLMRSESDVSFVQYSNVISDSIHIGVDNSRYQNETVKDKTYLGFSVQPELTYYLNNHIGIMLKMGGIRYENYQGEYHNWTVDFNPACWSYGLTFSFGKEVAETQ